jgi:hypothetical protein
LSTVLNSFGAAPVSVLLKLVEFNDPDSFCFRLRLESEVDDCRGVIFWSEADKGDDGFLVAFVELLVLLVVPACKDVEVTTSHNQPFSETTNLCTNCLV